MKKQEEWSVRGSVEGVFDPSARHIFQAKRCLRSMDGLFIPDGRFVVDIKTPEKTVGRGQEGPRNKGRRAIALFTQDYRQWNHVGGQWKVVAIGPVLPGRLGRQKSSVGRKGPGGWRECLTENDSVPCHLIHYWSGPTRVPIDAEMIATQRIDGNEKDVRPRPRRRRKCRHRLFASSQENSDEEQTCSNSSARTSSPGLEKRALPSHEGSP